MCARVCPTETLCEEACVRNDAEDKPVRIGLLQRYATDHYMAGHETFGSRATPTGKKVAVVGAGPAGLSAAHALARAGHDVTIFEARPKAGGLNEHGIAAYKAPDDFARKEVDFILAVGGITVENGKALGRDIRLADLRASHDAVFLGLGLQAVNALGLEGEGMLGVEDAVAWIEGLRQAADKATVPVGRRVVVIGGGMTAVDAAVQAKKLGAESVTMVYRRGPAEMNAFALRAGRRQDGRCHGPALGRAARAARRRGVVTGVEFERTAIGLSGKLEGTGERFVVPCDQVMKAIGQVFVAGPVAGETATALALEKNRIKVDAENRTSVPGVWAGGDCILGGEDLTVQAVEHGKIAARSIIAALSA